MTVDEMLAAWDRGETVWTLEMGGLGPGYEQALQIAAIEFCRARGKLKRTGNNAADYEAWDRICGETLTRIDKDLGGLSGAQFGAAKQLSWFWCFEQGGYQQQLDTWRAGKMADRMIMVSRHFPRTPEPPAHAPPPTDPFEVPDA